MVTYLKTIEDDVCREEIYRSPKDVCSSIKVLKLRHIKILNIFKNSYTNTDMDQRGCYEESAAVSGVLGSGKRK